MSRDSDAIAYTEQGKLRVKTMPQPVAQKFDVGSRVRITKAMPSYMTHFECGKDATVLHTYAHAYGGTYWKHYALDIDGMGFRAWYHEEQLTAIS